MIDLPKSANYYETTLPRINAMLQEAANRKDYDEMNRIEENYSKLNAIAFNRRLKHMHENTHRFPPIDSAVKDTLKLAAHLTGNKDLSKMATPSPGPVTLRGMLSSLAPKNIIRQVKRFKRFISLSLCTPDVDTIRINTVLAGVISGGMYFSDSFRQLIGGLLLSILYSSSCISRPLAVPFQYDEARAMKEEEESDKRKSAQKHLRLTRYSSTVASYLITISNSIVGATVGGLLSRFLLGVGLSNPVAHKCMAILSVLSCLGISPFLNVHEGEKSYGHRWMQADVETNTIDELSESLSNNNQNWIEGTWYDVTHQKKDNFETYSDVVSNLLRKSNEPTYEEYLKQCDVMNESGLKAASFSSDEEMLQKPSELSEAARENLPMWMQEILSSDESALEKGPVVDTKGSRGFSYGDVMYVNGSKMVFGPFGFRDRPLQWMLDAQGITESDVGSISGRTRGKDSTGDKSEGYNGNDDSQVGEEDDVLDQVYEEFEAELPLEQPQYLRSIDGKSDDIVLLDDINDDNILDYFTDSEVVLADNDSSSAVGENAKKLQDILNMGIDEKYEVEELDLDLLSELNLDKEVNNYDDGEE